MLEPLLLGLALATAPTSPPPAAAPDYADEANWLCRPGRRDACAAELDSTVIDANGRMRREAVAPQPAPPIDCFYVYPTVSMAPGLNAPLRATEAEARAARLQVARFRSVCRVFAPLYRQLTVELMRRGEDGERVEGVPAAAGQAERDVLAAWRRYMSHDNAGRGVVLIGHSQGAGILQSVIRREIDGKATQAQLVSAILPGNFVEVAKGRDVGGTFKSIPACRSAGQTGCVISYDSWRRESPPSPTHRPEFEPGAELLCVNPAALAGGSGELRPYLSSTGETIIPSFTAVRSGWTRSPAPAPAAPFVQLPGLLHAECVDDPRGDYLAVSLRPRPGDRRRGLISGDVVHRGKVADYGLHLIDIELAAGNLVEIVRRQSTAYRGPAAPGPSKR